METTTVDLATLEREAERDLQAEAWGEDWDQFRGWLIEKYLLLDEAREGMAKKKGFDERDLKAMEEYMFGEDDISEGTTPYSDAPLNSDSLLAEKVPLRLTTPDLWDAYELALTMRISILLELEALSTQELQERAPELVPTAAAGSDWKGPGPPGGHLLRGTWRPRHGERDEVPLFEEKESQSLREAPGGTATGQVVLSPQPGASVRVDTPSGDHRGHLARALMGTCW